MSEHYASNEELEEMYENELPHEEQVESTRHKAIEGVKLLGDMYLKGHKHPVFTRLEEAVHERPDLNSGAFVLAYVKAYNQGPERLKEFEDVYDIQVISPIEEAYEVKPNFLMRKIEQIKHTPKKAPEKIDLEGTQISQSSKNPIAKMRSQFKKFKIR